MREKKRWWWRRRVRIVTKNQKNMSNATESLCNPFLSLALCVRGFFPTLIFCVRCVYIGICVFVSIFHFADAKTRLNKYLERPSRLWSGKNRYVLSSHVYKIYLPLWSHIHFVRLYSCSQITYYTTRLLSQFVCAYVFFGSLELAKGSFYIFFDNSKKKMQPISKV